MTDRPIDRERFAEKGFAVVGLIGRRDRRRILRQWKSLAIDEAENYFASSVHADRSTARSLDQLLKAELAIALAAVLPGTTSFLAAFIAKGSHGGAVDLHPDWTYTDERAHRSIVAWCPLIDTGPDNGTMQVIEGSHRRVKGLRGSGDIPSPLANLPADLLSEHTTTVPLHAGEAILWDGALLHGSGPNTTAKNRPAVAIASAPTGADLVHFHRETGGRLEGFVIDESYYTTEPFGERPANGTPIEPWDHVVQPLTPEDLALTGANPSPSP